MAISLSEILYCSCEELNFWRSTTSVHFRGVFLTSPLSCCSTFKNNFVHQLFSVVIWINKFPSFLLFCLNVIKMLNLLSLILFSTGNSWIYEEQLFLSNNFCFCLLLMFLAPVFQKPLFHLLPQIIFLSIWNLPFFYYL